MFQAMESAKREVDDFDPVMHAHAEAMDCQDCEEDIKKAVHLFERLEAAEEQIFQHMESGRLPVEQYAFLQDVVHYVYGLWLPKGEFVLRRATQHHMNGFDVAEISKLSECFERAKESIRATDEIREYSLSHDELTAYARHACGSAKQLQNLSQMPVENQ